MGEAEYFSVFVDGQWWGDYGSRQLAADACRAVRRAWPASRAWVVAGEGGPEDFAPEPVIIPITSEGR